MATFDCKVFSAAVFTDDPSITFNLEMIRNNSMLAEFVNDVHFRGNFDWECMQR